MDDILYCRCSCVECCGSSSIFPNLSNSLNEAEHEYIKTGPGHVNIKIAPGDQSQHVDVECKWRKNCEHQINVDGSIDNNGEDNQQISSHQNVNGNSIVLSLPMSVSSNAQPLSSNIEAAPVYMHNANFYANVGLFTFPSTNFDVTTLPLTYKNASVNRLYMKEQRNPSKAHQCDLCEKAFASKSNLVKHRRIHTREKPYKCDRCNKAFSQTSNLITHQRIHTGEKPYQCDLCLKSFSHKGTLTVHRRIHTGEKPYQCDLCEKAFSQKVSLNIHQRIHYEDEDEMEHTSSPCLEEVQSKYRFAHFYDVMSV